MKRAENNWEKIFENLNSLQAKLEISRKIENNYRKIAPGRNNKCESLLRSTNLFL